jgi:tryptophan synthase beta chain
MIKLKKGIPLYDQHDKNYMYGGKFGSNYIPETLWKPVEDLTKTFNKLRNDKKFLREKEHYFNEYIGSPTPLVRLTNLSRHLGGAEIWAKDISKAKFGCHKIYSVIVHALICKRSGKKAWSTETGAGYNGKVVAMVGKHFKIPTTVFMGKRDYLRQSPNVNFMKKAGAKVIPVDVGNKSLIESTSESMRYWVANCDKSHLVVGSVVGPNIFQKICAWSVSQISKELKIQIKQTFKKMPKKLKLVSAVGGGSSSYGLWDNFIDDDKKQVELIGIEAEGKRTSKLHSAPLSKNCKLGILHGSAQYVFQNKEGQINSSESISSGLSYSGISSLHCLLKDAKRAKYYSVNDDQVLEAFKIVSKLEDRVSPSLEPLHAYAWVIANAKKFDKSTIIVIGNSGHSYKDKHIIQEELGYYPNDIEDIASI